MQFGLFMVEVNMFSATINKAAAKN
jgi:hypothetical protein